MTTIAPIERRFPILASNRSCTNLDSPTAVERRFRRSSVRSAGAQRSEHHA